MPDYTRVYSSKIKTHKDYYLATALVHLYSSGDIEYCASIEDGSRPKPYIDRATLAIIHPPGHAQTIIHAAASWADALEQLQALADEYGTLQTGAGIYPMATKGKPNEDSKDDD